MIRTYNTDETFNLILDTALNLFMEKGYEGTSIKEIGDNLEGDGTELIYNHFKSKEDILISITDRVTAYSMVVTA